MARVAILDYDAGNLTSVQRAVRHLGQDALVTRDPAVIRDAGRVISPGVGAAGAAMASLARSGLDEELRAAHAAGKPILGICVGCQVIFEHSEEDGGTDCLGFLPGDVVRFRFGDGVSMKIPHMGWNELRLSEGAAGGDSEGRLHPVFRGIPPGSQFYFVHSYHPSPTESSDVQGRTTYGGVDFASAVARGNLVAVQFHAEKSGRAGLKVLENFLEWNI